MRHGEKAFSHDEKEDGGRASVGGSRHESPSAMRVDISTMRENDRLGWDRFASDHGDACPYQLAAWRDVVARSYLHDTNYFIAARSIGTHVSMVRDNEMGNVDPRSIGEIAVVGILPLVHIRHWMFGNSLVSMPYCDAGGVLATDGIVERMLVEHGLRAADTLRVPVVELRQYQPLTCMDEQNFLGVTLSSGQREVEAVSGWRVSTATTGNKVRMLLDLPESPDALMQSFKAKLRSQVRKPIKDGLVTKIGGVDLIDDFYDVFVANMRDLGSPVHSKELILQVLLNFPERARIFIVYGRGMPMACSLTLGFNGVLSNPWASSLRRYGQFAPNMLLYWRMLEYACAQGYRKFDFGRSNAGEGTYRFKEQWGARPAPLFWYRFARTGHFTAGIDADGGRMARAMEYWKRLPVPVTRLLGPKIRRYISL